MGQAKKKGSADLTPGPKNEAKKGNAVDDKQVVEEEEISAHENITTTTTTAVATTKIEMKEEIENIHLEDPNPCV